MERLVLVVGNLLNRALAPGYSVVILCMDDKSLKIQYGVYISDSARSKH